MKGSLSLIVSTLPPLAYLRPPVPRLLPPGLETSWTVHRIDLLTILAPLLPPLLIRTNPPRSLILVARRSPGSISA